MAKKRGEALLPPLEPGEQWVEWALTLGKEFALQAKLSLEPAKNDAELAAFNAIQTELAERKIENSRAALDYPMGALYVYSSGMEKLVPALYPDAPVHPEDKLYTLWLNMARQLLGEELYWILALRRTNPFQRGGLEHLLVTLTLTADDQRAPLYKEALDISNANNAVMNNVENKLFLGIMQSQVGEGAPPLPSEMAKAVGRLAADLYPCPPQCPHNPELYAKWLKVARVRYAQALYKLVANESTYTDSYSQHPNATVQMGLTCQAIQHRIARAADLCKKHLATMADPKNPANRREMELLLHHKTIYHHTRRHGDNWVDWAAAQGELFTLTHALETGSWETDLKGLEGLSTKRAACLQMISFFKADEHRRYPEGPPAYQGLPLVAKTLYPDAPDRPDDPLYNNWLPLARMQLAEELYQIYGTGRKNPNHPDQFDELVKATIGEADFEENTPRQLVDLLRRYFSTLFILESPGDLDSRLMMEKALPLLLIEAEQFEPSPSSVYGGTVVERIAAELFVNAPRRPADQLYNRWLQRVRCSFAHGFYRFSLHPIHQEKIGRVEFITLSFVKSHLIAKKVETHRKRASALIAHHQLILKNPSALGTRRVMEAATAVYFNY